MSEFKGTPGPWRTTERTFMGVGVLAGDMDLQIDGPLVAVWWKPGSSPEVCDANARLIAAAPDLLEALTELVGIIDGAVADDRSAALKLQIDSFTCQPARAAIAKALGEGQ